MNGRFSKYLLWVQIYLKMVFCIFVLCGSAIASESSIDLWPRTKYLEDTQSVFTAETVITLKSQFSSTKDIPYANFGMRKGSIWLHIVLDDKIERTKFWTLTFGYPLLGLAEIYLFKDNRLVLQDDVGYNAKNLKNRPKTHKLDVPIPLDEGTYDLIIRVSSEGSLLVPMNLEDSNKELKNRSVSNLLQGIYLGIISCLIIFGLVNAAILKNPIHLSFSISVFFMAMFTFTLQGMSAEYFWGSNRFLSTHAAHIPILLNIGFNILFLNNILLLKETLPKYSQLLSYIMKGAFICEGLILTGLINFRIAHQVAFAFGIITILCVLMTFWAKSKCNSNKILILFAGWIIYSIASITLVLMFLGILKYSIFTFDYFQISSLIEMMGWFVVLTMISREKIKEKIHESIEKRHLITLAETDQLTGLANRRALTKHLDLSFRSVSYNSMCAILMLDLDRFKAVNDQYGHHVGDELLKFAAQRLASQLRSKDFICRYGGDEFVIILDYIKDSDFVRELCEKLIDSFSAPFLINGKSLSVGLTIGYAIAPFDSTEAEHLLELADRALYVGKKAGRGIAFRSKNVNPSIKAVV